MIDGVSRKILTQLCDTIEATGGVVSTEVGYEPVGDRDWLDIGECYVLACAALDRKPLVSEDDEEYDEVTP